MKTNPGKRSCLAARLAAAWLCAVMLAGLIQVPALAGAADDPSRLVDLYCSQSAKDALGEDQLEALVGLIVTSIEPQAVNLLIERFPCFADAAASGEVASISSEKLREGLSAILERLHRGETLDEVIRDISGGAYADTMDFTRRFIKGNYNEEIRDYDGDPQSLAFCVGYINYMNRLDALDPDTHPAGSVLMDDFGTTRPTPLEADAVATSDFYRFVESNTLVASTVPSDHTIDGETSFSGRDSFDSILEQFMAQ